MLSNDNDDNMDVDGIVDFIWIVVKIKEIEFNSRIYIFLSCDHSCSFNVGSFVPTVLCDRWHFSENEQKVHKCEENKKK